MVNFGAALAILTANQPSTTSTTGLTLIFSLLNVRKKTAAVIAGLAIGATCLWAVAAWQNVSREELINILLATLLMLVGIMLAAFIIIAGCKLLLRLAKKLGGSNPSAPASPSNEGE
jgi:hypothetical protein